jgi:two-component system response regulator LytT
MAISALIVDDEQLAREELAFLLKEHPEVEVVGEAGNGIAAIRMIDEYEPDLVFLDVQMPGLDGLSVVRKMLERGGRLPHFIFATAFDQYAVEAFELAAADYVMKPIEKTRLKKSLDRARRLLESSDDTATEQVEKLLAQLSDIRSPTKLLVRSGSRMLLVDEAELIYATIEEGVITVVASGIEGMANYRTIEELQAHLDASLFWRPHRSFLVNINRIKEVIPWFKSSYQLRMNDRDGTSIPVSRAQTKRLRELFKL